MDAISPYIRLLAINNITFFTILGIILQWTLTRGLETLVVLSMKTYRYIGIEHRPQIFANSINLTAGSTRNASTTTQRVKAPAGAQMESLQTTRN